MSYVDPSIKDKFETLSKELQEAILERDVKLYSMKDLIKVLEEIVAEGE
ncbi:MAG TPA: molecular chaperone GroEL [Clostridiales bacterium]|nr:molecular chaperone GroEL [Clostridiales bacterium]